MSSTESWSVGVLRALLVGAMALVFAPNSTSKESATPKLVTPNAVVAALSSGYAVTGKADLSTLSAGAGDTVVRRVAASVSKTSNTNGIDMNHFSKEETYAIDFVSWNQPS